MFKGLFVILLSLMISLTFSFAEIEVKISAEKTEYLVAEPVIMNIEFYNNSKYTDSINVYLYDQFYDYLKIKSDVKVNIISSGLNAEYYGFIPWEVFSPMEKKSFKFDLLVFRGDEKIVTGNVLQRLYFSSGKYSLFSGSLNMPDTLNFEIIKPLGLEKDVYSKLIKTFEFEQPGISSSENLYLKRKLFCEIANEYENSIYQEYVVYMYNKISESINIDTIDIRMNRKFVDKFPDSYYLPLIFNKLCRAIYINSGSESTVIEYLEKIINNSENNSVFKLAKEQMLKKEYLN